MKQIRFDDQMSYDDFGMKLLSYTINPPKVKKVTEDNPGGNGIIDLTEWMGYPVYENRDASFVFDLMADSVVEMEEKLSNVYDALNGLEKKISLGDGYYYTGRLTITTEPINNLFRLVNITGSLYPYKLTEKETSVSVSATSSGKTATIKCGNMPVMPTISSTADATIQFNGSSYSIKQGEQIAPGLMLKSGNNTVVVKGSGTVTFKYREGRF